MQKDDYLVAINARIPLWLKRWFDSYVKRGHLKKEGVVTNALIEYLTRLDAAEDPRRQKRSR